MSNIKLQEVWKQIKDFPKYEVSNYGRIRSKRKILALSITEKNYLRIKLFHNEKRKNFRVHRLVAEYFVLNPENKPEINHKDSNRQNNYYLNLEWVTSSENNLHMYSSGRRNKINSGSFKKNHSYIRKSVTVTNLITSQTVVYKSLRQASKLLRISREDIALICQNKKKQPENLTIRYTE